MKKPLSSLFVLLLTLAGTTSSNAQVISTFAGTGIAGFSGNGGAATAAKINNPTGIAFDANGNTYISDYNNHQIRKVNASGVITTVVGTGTAGFSGDGGPAINAKLSLPSTLIFDNAGNMYIVDGGNGAIRKVTPSGIISTVVGTGTNGYSGDGGLATSAQLNYPCGVYIDAAGNMYIPDRSNHRVRKVNTSGIISTYAGTGTGGFSGDGAAATAAKLNMPNGVTFDAAGNAYIADAYNNRIRKVTPGGVISTFAGTGTAGASGDGGAATAAQLNKPFGLTFDGAGNSYISDFQNHKIRKINQAGIISTLAGTGTGGYSGDGGISTGAKINSPEKVTVDAIGNIYIPDAGNQRVRIITCTQPTVSATSSQSMICTGESANLTGYGASTYSWSTGSTGSVIAVSPTVTTTYSVTGTNSVTGCTNNSAVTVNVSSCIGIKEISKNDEFQLYPNPFKSNIIIVTKTAKLPIRVFNSLGSLIYISITESEKTEIDLSNQTSGIYFIRIGSGTKKIIKE